MFLIIIALQLQLIHPINRIQDLIYSNQRGKLWYEFD